MTGRERNNRCAHLHVFGPPVPQHHERAPTRIDIASTSPECLENHRLQPVPCIGWRIAAPRCSIRLLDGNDPLASSAAKARSSAARLDPLARKGNGHERGRMSCREVGRVSVGFNNLHVGKVVVGNEGARAVELHRVDVDAYDLSRRPRAPAKRAENAQCPASQIEATPTARVVRNEVL